MCMLLEWSWILDVSLGVYIVSLSVERSKKLRFTG